MKILIAEDGLTPRKVHMALLKKHGHEVVATVNGAEAWAAIGEPDAPKLAILDWICPSR